MSATPTLADRIEAASGPDRELDADILQIVGGPSWDAIYREAQLPCGCPHDAAVERARELAGYRYPFTSSIDTALTLLTGDLPRLLCLTDMGDGTWTAKLWKQPARNAATPALAICAAALRARATWEVG